MTNEQRIKDLVDEFLRILRDHWLREDQYERLVEEYNKKIAAIDETKDLTDYLK